MKSSFLMIILGMMIIISFYSYSYSLPDGYAIQQQSTTAQPPSQLPPPQTAGEGQQQSATAQPPSQLPPPQTG
ncbi:MAG: hypothetical protein ACXW0J_07290, partial [Nitrososphaeraceae archaeon]